MAHHLKQLDKIEILTLMDNYIDLVSQDNSEIVQKAMPLKDMEIKNSILAEHGFSSFVTSTEGSQSQSMLLDFGFSEHGAAYNADDLGVDLKSVQIMALSHGHLDHVGGLSRISEQIGKEGIKLVLHPAAFTSPRFVKITDEFKLTMPAFTREKAESAGIDLVTTRKPYGLLDDSFIFLGEIPRETDFEKGAANLCCIKDGIEKQDAIDDDTAVIANLKGKGLVVLSGCAHSGIINTVKYAQKVSGIEQVHAVIGGFHLTGPEADPVIENTIKGFKKIDPDFIVPTHCTGRKAVMEIEKAFPEKFILNMSGTKLTFSA